MEQVGPTPGVHRHRWLYRRTQVRPWGKGVPWSERVITMTCELCGQHDEVVSHRQTDLYPEPAVLQAMTSIIGEREVAAR